jgi:excisionase family DNA binding protein
MTIDTEYMTVEEVAKLFRVSRMTIYRMIHRGDLRAVQIGRRTFRIDAAIVHGYLASYHILTQDEVTQNDRERKA